MYSNIIVNDCYILIIYDVHSDAKAIIINAVDLPRFTLRQYNIPTRRARIE